MRMFINILGIIGFIIASYVLFDTKSNTPKIGFVDSQRLITGFGPAFEVEKALKSDEDGFNQKLKILEDSLKSYMDTMSVKYDKADAKGKRQFQDELAARNQQINNATHAHRKKMDELRMEKMQGVYDKVNSYMKEFGEKHGYTLIFGTVQGGNILFGEKRTADLTQRILDGLNERYK